MTTAATILLVEDDGAQRRLLCHILRSQGYTVLEAADGSAALRALDEREPDLIITDLEMPGLDGLALVRTIRADPRYAGLPIVMLTGRNDESSRLTGLEAGVDDYLAKPGARAEVLARVRNLLRLRQALRTVEQQNGELKAIMVTLRESQDRAIAAERLAYVGTVAVGVCHELNNPLAAMRANMTTLREYGEELMAALPESVRTGKLNEAIDDHRVLCEDSLLACDRIAEVVTQFQAFQNAGAQSAPRTSSLGDVTASAVRQVRRNVGVELTFEPPKQPIRLDAQFAVLTRSVAALLGRCVSLGNGAARIVLDNRDSHPTLEVYTTCAAPMDLTAFFRPSEVQNGRLSYNFAIAVARDELTQAGVQIRLGDEAGAMHLTLEFPPAREDRDEEMLRTMA